jgi:glycosyltransferase involved in cell wall biosynthesis
MPQIDHQSSHTIIYVISNLREMDWLVDNIQDLSSDHRLVVVNFSPRGVAGFKDMLNTKIKVFNLVFEKPKHLFRVIFQVGRIFLVFKPKLVLAHGFFSSLATVVAGRVTRVRRIITVRHHGKGHEDDFILRFGDLVISKMSHKLIAISESTKSTLLEEGVPKEKIVVIPNAIDLRKFKSRPMHSRYEVLTSFGLNESDFVVGVISRFVEWKGIEYILQAFDQVTKVKSNARLILANVDEKNDKLAQSLSRFEKGRVFVIETLIDVPSFYQSVDVFVHTPVALDAEPAGMVYLEALASEVPSIFTVSGLARQISNLDKYAWVVDFKDPVGIASALLEISEGRQKEKISLDALSPYDIETHTTSLRKLIADIECE